jgi:hypothetical protein
MKFDPKKLIAELVGFFALSFEKGKFNFKKFLEYMKKKVVELLKSQAVKAVLKKLLGSAAAGGFLGFVITYVVEELFEEVAEPIIKLAFRKMGYIYDRTQGTITIKKLNRANEEGREEDADIILDNI